MVPGIKIALGDKEFEVPPISLGMLRNGLGEKLVQHDKLITEPGNNYTPLLILRGEIVIAALRRNYSEVEFSDFDLWDRLDYANVNAAWNAVLGLSGMVGEAAATETETGVTTSSRSTPPSPPATDGTSE
jgi:hypothetical protein